MSRYTSRRWWPASAAITNTRWAPSCAPGLLFRGRPWAWASGLGENVSDGANAPSGVVVSHIIRANAEHDKPPMLLVLRGQLDELFILIRLAKEVQAFKSFAACRVG